jgi:PAS domain S-box-containing protein
MCSVGAVSHLSVRSDGPVGSNAARSARHPDEGVMGNLRSLAQHPAGGAQEKPSLRAVAGAAPTMLAYWGADRRNVAANEAYLHWYGFSASEMRGLHLREVLGAELYEEALPRVEGALAGVPRHFQCQLVDTSGVARPVQATYSPHVLGGRVVGFSALVTDVTAGAAHTDAQGGAACHARVRAVIVDGDALTRAGLRAVLASAPDIDIVGEATGGDDALAAVWQARPDVVVMDARTPGVEGFLATRRSISSRGSAFPRVMVLTSSAIDEYLFAPGGDGPSVVLAKRARPEELIEGVRAVARGDEGGRGDDRRRWPGELPVDGRRWRPTKREREVLELVAYGFSNPQIARRLFLSINTVKSHLTHLYMKLGMDREQLIVANYEGTSLRHTEVGPLRTSPVRE